MNPLSKKWEAGKTLKLTRLLASSVFTAAVVASASSACAAGPDQQDASELRFTISRFDVTGNSLLPQGEIDAAVAPYTGSGRTFGDVQRALEALEAAYHARGWNIVTVQLPEQELDQGVVRLNVQQPRLGRVNVSGNKFFDTASVRRAMPTLVPGATPNMDAVSANLKLANESPVRALALKLQSAPNGEAIDANLQVTDSRPWKATLNLDNNGTSPTGKTNLGVVLQHANLWGRDHLASIQYSTTAEEPSKVGVWGVGYHVPLYALGDSLDFYANYSNVNTGSVTAGLFDLAVVGKGTVAGARYNHVLPRRGELEQRLIYGIDVKAFKNSVLFAGFDFGSDVTVRPFSFGWTASSPLAGGNANLSLTLVQNIAGGSREEIARARDGGEPSFRLLRFATAYTIPVGEQWQMRWLVNGQLSGHALVPGEQFGAGGSSSVRGLAERGIGGDSGVFTNAELYSPALGGGGEWQWRMLAFVDSARVRRNKPLPGEDARASVASAGIGLRLTGGTSLSAQVDYGHVVRTHPSIGNDRNKVHVRVALAY